MARQARAGGGAGDRLARFGPAAVVAAAIALFCTGLGAIDLWAPDEPRYAQIAEELRALPRGPADLIVLRLDGTVYTQKPPLWFWLAALAGAPAGRVEEAAARLPAAVAAVLVVAGTLVLGRRLLGTRGAGVLAAAVLLSMPRFAHQARRAQLDVLLCALELGALLAYWRIEHHALAAAARKEGDEEGGGGAETHPPRRWLAALHGAVALAVLTKGPVGALPWLVVAAHRAWERRPGSLRTLFPVWGVVLGVAPALLWTAGAALLAPAGWLDEAVVDNVLARFFRGTDHVRPFWYYALHLPADTLPWTPLVAAGAVFAWRRRGAPDPRERSAVRLLLAWAAVFVVFFSLSAGKRGVYMIPLLPALAVLAAIPLLRWRTTGRLPAPALAWGAAVLGATAAAGAWLVLGAPGWPRPAQLDPVPASFAWALLGTGAMGLAAGAALRRSPRPAAGRILAFVVAVAAVETSTFALLYPAIDPVKSPRPIAEAAAAVAPEQTALGVFRHGAFAGGLAYYSGRPVEILESASDVYDFAAAGHRIVVVRARDRPALDGFGVRHVHASARTGRRRMLVVEIEPPRRAGARTAVGGG